METRQTKLGFALDPGDIAERRNMLGLVVLRLHGMDRHEGGLYARELLLWIFNTTSYGTNGELRKSYAELAACPWGLCCCETRVRRVVRTLRKHRVLRVDENRYQSDGQTANSYSLDWDGIRHLLGLRGRSGVHGEQGGGHGEQGGGHHEHPFKEETPLPVPSVTSGPDPEGAGRERFLSGKNTDTDADLVREELLATVPELTAAADVMLGPLPATDFAKGVFRTLTASDVLKPLSLVRWFRQQLSAPCPVMRGTEADLLLVLAAAMYVNDQPRDEVKRTVGLFVSLISRRDWRRITPYVPDARRLLDEAIAAKGPDPLGRIMKEAVIH